MPDGDINFLGEMVNLAHQFQKEGKLEEAGHICSRVIGSTPNPTTLIERVARAEAFNFLASMAAQREQLGTAVDFFHQAISLAHTASEATVYRTNLIRVLLQIGWKERARVEADRVMQIAPPELKPTALRLRGLCSREEGKAGESLEYYQKAAALSASDDWGVRLELAAILADSADLEGSKEVYEEVLANCEQYKAEALHGVGLCLMRMMRCREAIGYFNEALAIDNGMQMARWNRALSYLTIGNLADGWRDHESRFHLGSMMSGVATPAKRFNRPWWGGQTADEIGPKRVHFHSEMGHGDTLQFCRYLPIVRDMGHDVRLETSRELTEVLSYSLPGIAVVEQASDWPGGWGLDDFDLHLPLMSAPTVLRTRIDTIPSEPYLLADPSKAAEWKERLDGVKIGLCWHGRSREALWVKELDRRRSVPFSLISDFLDRRSEPIVSLQNDGNEEHPNLLCVKEHLKSFADTAALIANLDLVITVDTAVLHLAAGMGKETWLLDRWDCCWRWMPTLFPDTSPWYPSLKIFRQPQPEDWQSVMNRVADRLETVR